jgi:hypothetical protein
MQITNSLLRVVPVSKLSFGNKSHSMSALTQELLSQKGHFYLVAVRENDIPTIRVEMLEAHALQSEVSLSLFRYLSLTSFLVRRLSCSVELDGSTCLWCGSAVNPQFPAIMYKSESYVHANNY